MEITQTLAVAMIVLSILGMAVAVIQKDWVVAMWTFNSLVWVTQYLLK